MTALVGVPIKPFGVAKERLSPLLDAPSRARLGRAVARHTLEAVVATGAEAMVVSADTGVQAWARGVGFDAVAERPGSGLDGAGAAVVAKAGAAGRTWAVIHADLPLVTAADVAALLGGVPAGGMAIAPARDGGTTAIAGDVASFPFTYGPGSARRHLRRAADLPLLVVTRLGFALDLDTPGDLEAATHHRHGRWLLRVLPA